MEKFILSCESTVDMPYSRLSEKNIPVIFYSYFVDGIEYADDMLRNPDALPDFYRFIGEGKMPTTSQLNEAAYEDFFESLIPQGDILHIAFGSGMTASVRNAQAAAEAVMQAHPDRRVVVIDSLCSSSGYGMLVDYAADMRDAGKPLDETADWVLANRRNIHHQFFSTRLDFYRRSGRMSGSAAAIATLLGICPIMRLDYDGRIIAYDKVRGKPNAVKTTLNRMEAHAQNGINYAGKCYICHSDCLEEAEKLKKAVAEHFPALSPDRIEIFDIGTIIASHCGPGTVAVFFLGDEREPFAK